MQGYCLRRSDCVRPAAPWIDLGIGSGWRRSAPKLAGALAVPYRLYPRPPSRLLAQRLAGRSLMNGVV